MQLPVETTFQNFVVQFGGELVSNLISKENPPKNADYLFRKPLVIAELKVVEREAFTHQDKEKLDKLVNEWLQQGLIGPIFGTVQIELRKLPPPCQREWLSLHMAPWKRKLEDANKQIKQTKSLLNLPDACGVLFLCDDAVHSFAPSDVLNFITLILQAKKPDGGQIYSHLDRIVYFSVNPREVTEDGMGINFWLPAYRHQDEKTISEFLENFGRAWFQYHAKLFGTKPVQMSGKDQPFKGTWANGLHGLRIRSQEGGGMPTESNKPVCPAHQSQMRETMQWDLGKVIFYCPESGCKHRYVEGLGFTTVDEIISRERPE